MWVLMKYFTFLCSLIVRNVVHGRTLTIYVYSKLSFVQLDCTRSPEHHGKIYQQDLVPRAEHCQHLPLTNLDSQTQRFLEILHKRQVIIFRVRLLHCGKYVQ